MLNPLSNSSVQRYISLNLGLLKSCSFCLKQSLKVCHSDDKIRMMTKFASRCGYNFSFIIYMMNFDFLMLF